MTLSTKLLILVAIFMAGLGAGMKIQRNADVAKTVSVQKEAVKTGNKQNAKDAASGQLHAARRDKTAKADREVGERAAVAALAPDYHTCRLKPEDLDLLNEAIRGTTDGPKQP